MSDLLYCGTYLFVGAPKVGKSFFMGQLAYHVAMGLPLWEYEVHQGDSPLSGVGGRLRPVAADGAFIMQKKRRTDNTALLDIVY